MPDPPVLPDNVAESVRSVIARYTEVPLERISMDSSFEELGIDSLEGLSIVTDLEEAFNVTVSNDDALGLGTVRQAVELLQACVSEKAAQQGDERPA